MDLVFRERLDEIVRNSKTYTLLNKDEYFNLIDEMKAAENTVGKKSTRQYNLLKK